VCRIAGKDIHHILALLHFDPATERIRLTGIAKRHRWIAFLRQTMAGTALALINNILFSIINLNSHFGVDPTQEARFPAVVYY
jgi:hypothetical protein